MRQKRLSLVILSCLFIPHFLSAHTDSLTPLVAKGAGKCNCNFLRPQQFISNTRSISDVFAPACLRKGQKVYSIIYDMNAFSNLKN